MQSHKDHSNLTEEGIIANNYWYTDTDINKLLNYYHKDGVDANIISAAFPLLNESARVNFKETLFTCLIEASTNNQPSIIPVNLLLDCKLDDNGLALNANVSGSHWILVIVKSEGENLTLKYIDPLGNGTENHSDLIDPLDLNTQKHTNSEMWNRYLSKFNIIFNEVKSTYSLQFKVIYRGFIQQTTSSDCGPFLISNAYHELKTSGIIETDAKRLRREHQFSLSKTKIFRTQDHVTEIIQQKSSIKTPTDLSKLNYQARLLSLLDSIGAEIDYSSMAVAKLRQKLAVLSETESLLKLKNMFAQIKPITQLSLEQIDKIIETVEEAICNPENPDELMEILQLTYEAYSKFRHNFSQLNEDEKIELLSKICPFIFDQLEEHYLLKKADAQRLSCFDRYGNTIKPNATGNRPVQREKQLFLKADPGRENIAPGAEQMMVKFYKLFSLPHHTIAAATGFGKISNIPIETILSPTDDSHQNLEAYNALQDEIYKNIPASKVLSTRKDIADKLHYTPSKTHRVIQVGYGLGDVCLREMIALVQMFCRFEALKLQEEIINQLPLFWREEGFSPSANAAQALFENWLEFLKSKEQQERPLELQDLEQKSPENILLLWKGFVKNFGLNDLSQTIALLKLYPELMLDQSFADLADYPKLLRLVPQIWPNLEMSLCFETIVNWLDQVDRKNFSNLIVISLLANPSDGKGDNYRAELIRNEKGQAIKFRIVAIDNDNALANNITYTERKIYNSNFLVEVFCILYFLPSMNTPIENEIREHILSKHPAHWIIEWLLELYPHDQRYIEMITQGLIDDKDLFHNEDEPRLDIPLRFSSDIIIELYVRISSLQTTLIKNPSIKLADLFLKVDPVLAKYYETIKEIYKYPIDAFNAIYKKKLPLEEVLENIIHSASEAGEIINEQLELIKNHGKCPSEENKNNLDIDAALDLLLKNLNFAALPTAQAYDIIVSLARFKNMKPLNLKVSVETQTEWLHRAIANADLNTVKLLIQSGVDVNQPNLNGDTALHKFALYYDHEQYTDVLATQMANVISNQPNLKPHYENEQGIMPLFILTKAAKRHPNRLKMILMALVQNDIDLNVIDKESKETVLDRAVKRQHPQAFIILVECGAYRIENIQAAIRFVNESEHASEMSAAKRLLKNKNQSFSYQESLEQLTIPATATNLRKGDLLIEGVFNGVRYLPKEITDHLFDDKGDFIPKEKTKNTDVRDGTGPNIEYFSHGRRTVVAVKWKNNAFVIKFNPELPAIEYAVNQFAEMLNNHGTAFGETFCYKNHKGKSHVLQISQYIDGMDLQHYFSKNKDNDLSNLQSLDSYRLSQFILLSLLVNFEDAQPANLMLVPFITDHGEVSLQIVSVDNDHAFGPDFQNAEANAMPKLLTKCFVFCLDQMKHELHPQAVKEFLSHNPYEFLKSWLQILNIQTKKFDDLFVNKYKLSKWGKKSSPGDTVIGMPFKKKMITRLFTNFMTLQSELKQNPRITGLDLLSRIYLIAGTYYKESFDENFVQTQNPNSRFFYLVKDLYAINNNYYMTLTTNQDMLTIIQKDDIRDGKSYGPREALEILELLNVETSKLKNTLVEIQSGKCNIRRNFINGFMMVSSYEALLQKINWSDLTIKETELIMSYFIGIPLTNISLRNCKITNALFEKLIVHCPELSSLTLNNCSELTETIFKYLHNHAPHLRKIVLEAFNGTMIALPKSGRSNKYDLFRNLNSLVLKQCDHISCVNIESSNLKKLKLINCQRLIDFNLEYTHNNLECLKIYNCNGLIRSIGKFLIDLKKSNIRLLDLDPIFYYEFYDDLLMLYLEHTSCTTMEKHLFAKLISDQGHLDISIFSTLKEQAKINQHYYSGDPNGKYEIIYPKYDLLLSKIKIQNNEVKEIIIDPSQKHIIPTIIKHFGIKKLNNQSPSIRKMQPNITQIKSAITAVDRTETYIKTTRIDINAIHHPTTESLLPGEISLLWKSAAIINACEYDDLLVAIVPAPLSIHVSDKNLSDPILKTMLYEYGFSNNKGIEALRNLLTLACHKNYIIVGHLDDFVTILKFDHYKIISRSHIPYTGVKKILINDLYTDQQTTTAFFLTKSGDIAIYRPDISSKLLYLSTNHLDPVIDIGITNNNLITITHAGNVKILPLKEIVLHETQEQASSQQMLYHHQSFSLNTNNFSVEKIYGSNLIIRNNQKLLQIFSLLNGKCLYSCNIKNTFVNLATKENQNPILIEYDNSTGFLTYTSLTKKAPSLSFHDLTNVNMIANRDNNSLQIIFDKSEDFCDVNLVQRFDDVIGYYISNKPELAFMPDYKILSNDQGVEIILSENTTNSIQDVYSFFYSILCGSINDSSVDIEVANMEPTQIDHTNNGEILNSYSDNDIKLDNAPSNLLKIMTTNEIEEAKLISCMIAEGIHIDSKNADGKTRLHLACENDQLGLVRWLLLKGADRNLLTNKGESIIDLAVARGNHELLKYLASSNTVHERELSHKNCVHIREWPPTYKNQEVPLPTALLMTHIDPENTNVGHSSIQVVIEGITVQYGSLWPSSGGGTGLFGKPGYNNTLKEDISDEGSLPKSHVILYSLNMDNILSFFEKNSTLPYWTLVGGTTWNGVTYNCSGYVFEILKAGGILGYLVPEYYKQSTMLTPKEVMDICEQAKWTEEILYPETKQFFKERMNEFKTELIDASKISFMAYDKFINENPDTFFMFAKNFPDEVVALQLQLKQNVQQALREELLSCVKYLRNMDDDLLEIIDRLYHQGADMRSYDEEGYSAIHYAVKYQSLNIVSKLLNLYPNANNQAVVTNYIDEDRDLVFSKIAFFRRQAPTLPLDIAVARGNSLITDLILSKGGQSHRFCIKVNDNSIQLCSKKII